jgi:hypothetical protein
MMTIEQRGQKLPFYAVHRSKAHFMKGWQSLGTRHQTVSLLQQNDGLEAYT